MSAPEDIFIRNIMLYGREGFEALQKSFVVVVGLGGVGACAAEALARAGVGRLRIIDCDVIKPSDINRQLIALTTNINTPKAQAAGERLLAINPAVHLDCRQAFFHSDTAAELITPDADFVIDAIDSLNPKGELIRHCTDNKIPLISALGAGGRIDPFQLQVVKLDETAGCPLARALRRHLRSRGISTDITVIHSAEPPAASKITDPENTVDASGTYSLGRLRRAVPSIPTFPDSAGLIAANHVIFALLKKQGELS